MSPLDYLKKHGEEAVARLCKRVGTSPGYFRVIAYNKTGQRFSPKLTRKFHDATGGELNQHEHRPDVFGPPPKRRARAAA